MRATFSLSAVLLAATTLTAVAPTAQQADSFERKLNQVIARGDARPSGQRTEFSGDELNAYLQLRLQPRFPAGVTEPSVAMLDEGRLNGRATVDLDGIRKKSSGGWLDPAAYLGGKLPVTATGVLKTGNGRGQFMLESAEISGVPVPKTLLQEVVTYYTRSPELPHGVNLDEPFVLPVQIERIDVSAARATVVQ